ncbi:uncharacterized protein [Chiloscyllium punctatum]|uniref:uncharacterized protein n=1 Tax=Chiloscyllium punctatum TaxID=137246 RepID=UPI003B63588F
MQQDLDNMELQLPSGKLTFTPNYQTVVTSSKREYNHLPLTFNGIIVVDFPTFNVMSLPLPSYTSDINTVANQQANRWELGCNNPTPQNLDPNQMCRDMMQQLLSREKNMNNSDSVNKFLGQCDGVIPDSSLIDRTNPWLKWLVPDTHAQSLRILSEIEIEGGNQSFSTPNYFAHIQKIEAEKFPGLHFPPSDLIQQKNVSSLARKVEIELPPTLLDKVKEQPNVLISRIIFVIYGNTKLFQSDNNSTVLNNLVSGIEVVNVTIENLTDPVIIVFQNTTLPTNSSGKCAFWDFRKGSTSHGIWSESGCTTESQLHNITCKCNHLTSFAVLLDYHSDDASDVASSTHSIALIIVGAFIIFIVITVHCYEIISRMMWPSGKPTGRSRF